MGSVQAFPHKAGAATLADVWRAAKLTEAAPLRVREARLEDFAALRAVQRQAAPLSPALTLRQLESRRLAFPAGQLVAGSNGRISGFASCLLSPRTDYGSAPWRVATADGYFTTHDPSGSTLYCAELCVDPERPGLAVARALVLAQRRLCRRMNLRRIIAIAPLEGYAEAGDFTPEEYAMHAVAGDWPDASLRLHVSQGFQYCGILRDYLPRDASSCGHAALLAWLNPLFTPAGPPAFARRCA